MLVRLVSCLNLFRSLTLLELMEVDRVSQKVNNILINSTKDLDCIFKGYSSDQSYFSEINVKLAEKNKYATHSVQRSLEMCKNK